MRSTQSLLTCVHESRGFDSALPMTAALFAVLCDAGPAPFQLDRGDELFWRLLHLFPAREDVFGLFRDAAEFAFLHRDIGNGDLH